MLRPLLILALQVQAPPIALVDVSVIPIDRPGAIAHQTVLVREGRIAAVGPTATIAVPADAIRIDGRGGFVLPGFADMHTHPFRPFDLLTFLANGITTIRVMWGDTAQLAWRRDVERGALIGPRIVTSGAIIDGDPPSQPTMRVLTDPARARAEVEAQHRAGYDFIKVYNSVPKAVYDTIVAVARELGMPVAGHVPFEAGLAGAFAARQASIEHLRGYVAELVPADAPVQPGPTLKARTLAWNSADRSRIPALVERTVRAGVWNCPTIVVGYQFMLPAAEHQQLMARPEARLLRPEGAPDRSTISWLADFTEADFVEAKRAVGPQLELVAALAQAGARLMIGTDSWLQGFAFQDELELFERAGVPRQQILEYATRGGADFLGRAHQQGAVAVGLVADLQLVEANPLAGLSNLRRRRGVMARGRWFDRQELDGMLRPQ